MTQSPRLFDKEIFVSKENWVSDQGATHCFSCASHFDLVHRKHHCRMCGNIFDDKCSRNFLKPPVFVFENEKKIRVCNACFKKSEYLLQSHQSFSGKDLPLDATQIAKLKTYVKNLLNEKYEQQAENILSFHLKQNGLYEEWFNILKSTVKESVEMVKPDALEEGYHNINDLIKIKTISAPIPNAVQLVKGVVIRKNICHHNIPKEVETPDILMVKDNLEPYSSSEISVFDLKSAKQEKQCLEGYFNHIQKLKSLVIIVEGNVSRVIQDMMCKTNKVLLSKVKETHFRDIARCTGAKPINGLTNLAHFSFSLLGNCNQYYVNTLHGSDSSPTRKVNFYKNNEILAPSLIFFDGCDPSKGVTLILHGSDEQKLQSVKKCLKTVLIQIKNLSYERGILYQDLMFYHKKETLWRAIPQLSRDVPFNIDQQELRTQLMTLNDRRNEIFDIEATEDLLHSVGCTSHYLTGKISVEKAMKNNTLSFTKLVLTPINLSTFPDLSKKGKDFQALLLNKLKLSNSVHKDMVCQLEKDPVSMNVEYYNKDDVPLGFYLINKASQIFNKCSGCNKSCYNHTTIFLLDKFYVKVGLELKNSRKLKYVTDEYKAAEKDQENKKQKISKVKEGFRKLLNKLAHRRKKSFKFGSSQSKSTTSSVDSNDSQANMASEEIKMYIECCQCDTKLSEEVNLRQELFEYSFTKFIQSLTLNSKECQNNSGLEHASSEHDKPHSCHKYSAIFDNIYNKPNVKACCRSSCKSRVFKIDDLLIKFKVEPLAPFQISQVNYNSEGSRELVNKARQNLILTKQHQLKELMIGYLDGTIANIKKILKSIALTHNFPVNLDGPNFSDTLNNLCVIQNRSPYHTLLIKLLDLCEEMQKTKQEINEHATQNCSNHLEIDLQRKNYFKRLKELTTLLLTTKKVVSRLAKKTYTPFANQENSGNEDQETDIEVSKSKIRRKSTSQYKSALRDQEKVSAISLGGETDFFDKLLKGFYKLEDQSKNALQKFEIIPISETEPLSILAYSLNTSEYLERVYIQEGFSNLIESKEENLNEAFEAKISQLHKTNNLTEFQLTLPLSKVQINLFNQLLLDFNNNKRYPNLLLKNSRTSSVEHAEEILLFGELLKLPPPTTKPVFSCEKSINPNLKMIIYHPLQFEIIRFYNGINLESYIESISRSHEWASSGGKSGARFSKSYDERLLYKQLSKKEFTMLLGFAKEYLTYTFQSYKNKTPSLLTKIFGIYELQNEKKSPIYFIIMENLFFGMEQPLKVYDLKGSQLNRYSANKVQDDQTLLDTDYKLERNGEPLPLDPEYYEYVKKAISNDTEFLVNLRVIDYSLLLIIDEKNNSVRMGIIDHLRIYDFEKQLEHVGKKLIKGTTPTVTNPELYKERFEKEMKRYLTVVPVNKIDFIA